MLGLGLLTALLVAAFAVVLVMIRRFRRVSPSGILDATGVAESVRVDLAVLRAVPDLAGAVEGVRWSKLQKQYSGRTVVGGLVVFGPQRLTWAPDDRARRFGVRPFHLAWAAMAGVAVRTATATTSAALLVTLADGTVVELAGVNATAALAAVERSAKPPAPTD